MVIDKTIKQFRDIENFLVNRYFRTDWKSSRYIYSKHKGSDDEMDETDQTPLDDYVEDEFGIVQGSKKLLYPIKNLFMLLRAEYHNSIDGYTHRMFYWIYNPEVADELIKFAHNRLRIELHEVIFNPNLVKFFLDIDMLLSRTKLAHLVNYFSSYTKREGIVQVNFEDLLQNENTSHIAQILIEESCNHLANIYIAATYNAFAIKGIMSSKIDYCVATRNRPKDGGAFKLSIHIIFNVVLPIECCKELYEVIVEEGFNMHTDIPHNDMNDREDDDKDDDEEDLNKIMFAEFAQVDYSNTLKDLRMYGLDRDIKGAIDAQPYRRMGSLSIYGGYKHEHDKFFCMRLTKNFNYKKYDEPFITRTSSSFLKKVNLSKFTYQPAIVTNLGTDLSDKFIATVLNHIGNIPGVNPSNWDTITIKATGVFIRPRRNCSEYCKICERVHDTDNTLLIIGNEEADIALYKCSKNADTKLQRFYPSLDTDEYKPKKILQETILQATENGSKQVLPNKYILHENLIEVSAEMMQEEAAMKVERCDSDDEDGDDNSLDLTTLNERVYQYEQYNRYYCVDDISNDSNEQCNDDSGYSSSECPDYDDDDDAVFANQTSIVAHRGSSYQSHAGEMHLSIADSDDHSDDDYSDYGDLGDDLISDTVYKSSYHKDSNLNDTLEDTVADADDADNDEESDYESDNDIDESFFRATYPIQTSTSSIDKDVCAEDYESDSSYDGDY